MVSWYFRSVLFPINLVRIVRCLFHFALDPSNMLTVSLTDSGTSSKLAGDAVSCAVWAGLLCAAWQRLCVKKWVHSAPWVGWNQASNVSAFLDWLAAERNTGSCSQASQKVGPGMEKKKMLGFSQRKIPAFRRKSKEGYRRSQWQTSSWLKSQLFHFVFCCIKDSITCHCYSIFPNSLFLSLHFCCLDFFNFFLILYIQNQMTDYSS